MADSGKIRDYFESAYHSKDEKVVYTDRVFTVPNILTLSRLICLPLLIWLLLRVDRFGPFPAVIVGSYMLLSDALDGVLAKALGQISLTGAIMDPVVDKLVINSLAIFLVFKEWLPLWAIVPILFRDLGILVFGLRIFLNYGILITPIWMSRVTPLLWGAAFVVSVLKIELAKWILIPLAIVMTVVSGVAYYRKYKDLLKMKIRES